MFFGDTVYNVFTKFIQLRNDYVFAAKLKTVNVLLQTTVHAVTIKLQNRKDQNYKEIHKVTKNKP